MKCVGMQYLEAVRRLKARSFQPLRSLYIVFAPDAEIGGVDGAQKFSQSEIFQKLNVAIVLDEGQVRFILIFINLILNPSESAYLNLSNSIKSLCKCFRELS